MLLVILAVGTALRVTDASCDSDPHPASLDGNLESQPRVNASVQAGFLESEFFRQETRGCSGNHRWDDFQSSDVHLAQMMLAQHLECQSLVGSGASGETFVAWTTVPHLNSLPSIDDDHLLARSWPNDDILSLKGTISDNFWPNRGIAEDTKVAVKIQYCKKTKRIEHKGKREDACKPEEIDPEFAILSHLEESTSEPRIDGVVRMYAHAYLRFGYEAVVLEAGACDLRSLIFKRNDDSDPCGFGDQDRDQVLDFWDKYNIVRELVDGLLGLHRNGIVHADIKPANIVVKTDQKPKGARFIDFDGSCVEGNLTLPGVSDCSAVGDFGTEMYHAPENRGYFNGAGDYIRGNQTGQNSKKADIFSLGVTIYEVLFEGSFPYECFKNCDDKNWKDRFAPELVDVEGLEKSIADVVDEAVDWTSRREKRRAQLPSLEDAKAQLIELLPAMLDVHPERRSMESLRSLPGAQ